MVAMEQTQTVKLDDDRSLEVDWSTAKGGYVDGVIGVLVPALQALQYEGETEEEQRREVLALLEHGSLLLTTKDGGRDLYDTMVGIQS